ncbi:MAG TPA: MarR family transcriptional regulator [Woeseiaceae bacterium]|nr:MarR family transcriptional regulator [Woeseiaceae bacterium]
MASKRAPVGLRLARTAKAVSQAFDGALVEAGGSLPTWLVLLSLKTAPGSNQSKLAASMGIQGATLTHHLNVMENNGLLTRRRDPDNRREHRVELTDRGEALFRRLRSAAAAFDRRLRAGLPDREVARLEGLLDRLRSNVAADAPADR